MLLFVYAILDAAAAWARRVWLLLRLRTVTGGPGRGCGSNGDVRRGVGAGPIAGQWSHGRTGPDNSQARHRRQSLKFNGSLRVARQAIFGRDRPSLVSLPINAIYRNLRPKCYGNSMKNPWEVVSPKGTSRSLAPGLTLGSDRAVLFAARPAPPAARDLRGPE